MAGLKCLQLRYQITWLIWDNFIGSQWNASKCLPLFINLVPRGRDPFARSGWQRNADSGNEIDSSSIEDNRNRRSQRNLSNLPCREYIIWESREKSCDEICFTDIGVTIFFFYFARTHYNVVNSWCKNGRQDGQKSSGGCRFCRSLTFSYSDYVVLSFSLFLFCFVLFFMRVYWGPIRGGLNIPYPCNFLTKYPVSHKFRSQISRKLKYLLRYIL